LAEKDSGTQNLRLFLKSLASYVFLVVSALIAVPLGLVWLANGLLAFSVGNLRFLGLLPTTVGTIFMLNMFVYFASVGKGTPAGWSAYISRRRNLARVISHLQIQ